MEDLPFRPPYDMDKVSNAFLAANLAYPDPLDHMKASLKLETLASPHIGNHEFRRHRLSSYDAPMFFPFKEDDHFPEMHGHVKTENLQQDFHSLAPQVHMDANFEMPMPAKLQDYAIDYYRINRSRGPSFNLGPGRKNSEDLFAHGFDLLSYFNKNGSKFDATDKMSVQESQDNRMHHDFLDDLRTAPMLPHAFPSALTSLIESNFHYPGGLENPMAKDLAMNSLTHNIQLTQAAQQHFLQQNAETEQETEQYSELEPKSQKKRKTNNKQEIQTPVDSTPTNAQLKKVKSETKKNNKADEADPSLKPSKSMIEKPSAKKSAGQKSKGKKETGKQDLLQVKSEVEDRADKDEKSTEPSSINVSPNPKKEDLSALFNPKSGIVGTFGTAQELLGGLSLPAEVEEYINKSKLFNQIKAPVARKIGTLTLEERRIKIEKYLEKRKRRSWNKRVNYDCRKKVADNRLRIKGRFVTKDQAFGMLEALGIYPDPEKITNNEIKSLLTERFGAISNKKKDGEGEGNDGNGKAKKSGNGGDMSNVFADFEGDQDSSSLGSQDDAGNENYL